MFKIAASRTSWFNQLELAGALEMNIDLQRFLPLFELTVYKYINRRAEAIASPSHSRSNPLQAPTPKKVVIHTSNKYLVWLCVCVCACVCGGLVCPYRARAIERKARADGGGSWSPGVWGKVKVKGTARERPSYNERPVIPGTSSSHLLSHHISNPPFFFF